MRLLEALSADTRVYDLAQPLTPGIPTSPNHPGFRMALLRRHGDMVRADGSSAANELIVTGGHVGTHVDALAHVSYRGALHGGVPVEDALHGGVFIQQGIDAMEPLVCRGILLDIAGLKQVEVLPGGYAITAQDLALAERRAGVKVGAGDVVLLRSGWAQYFADPQTFIGQESGVPGPGLEAARWLVERGIRATGSDTTAYEQVPAAKGHSLLPVHVFLLFERGIHIIEILNLEGLTAAGVAEFLFILAPLKIIGGTGSPVRPLAVV